MPQLSIYMRAFIRAALCLIAVTTVLAFLSGTCGYMPSPAQQAWAQQPERGAPHLTPAQIDQMMAPIALYPDNLLAQILTAATHPSEIEMAARWSAANPRIFGQALANAMQLQSWDPSVKALTAVPQVLKMMNEKFGWTMQLGKAYLSQPQNIASTVQRLRALADASGNLSSSGQIRVERITVEEPVAEIGPEYIVIEPTDSDRIFVPVYDPLLIYGDWPYPYNRPFYWSPERYVAQEAFGFGPAVLVGTALWASFDWNSGQVFINPKMYSNFNKVPIAQALELSAAPVKFNPGQRGDMGFRNQDPNAQFRNSAIGDGRTMPLRNTTNTGTGQNFMSNPGINSQRGYVGPSGGTAGPGFSNSNVANRDATSNPSRFRDSVNGGSGMNNSGNRGNNPSGNGGNPIGINRGATNNPGKVRDTTIGGAGRQGFRGTRITSINRPVTSTNKPVTSANRPARTTSSAVTTSTGASHRSKVVTNGTRRGH